MYFTETTFGMKMNSRAYTGALLEALSGCFRIVSERIFHIWLQPQWLFKLFPQHTESQKYKNVAYKILDMVLKSKRQEIKNQEKCDMEAGEIFDFSSYEHKSFFEKVISMGPTGFTDLELKEEAIVIIGAGTDTQAIALGFTLQVLGKYPLIQEKVYEELREVFGDSDRPLVKEDIRKLKYLERVIKETLRLFPPTPFIARKMLVDTKLPSGRVLPAGSAALLSIWGAHRDPKYWGSEAEVFDPDRFLPERLHLQHACSYMPFSYGPRNCIGHQYAMLSLKTALSAILRRYRAVLEPELSNVPRIRVKYEILMKAVDNYQVALEKRKCL